MQYKWFNVSVYLRAYEDFSEADVQRAMFRLLNSNASTFDASLVVAREES